MDSFLKVAAEGQQFGLGNLWIIGWYIFSMVSTGYCMAVGAAYYGLYISFTGGNIPDAMDDAIEFCYGSLASFY